MITVKFSYVGLDQQLLLVTTNQMKPFEQHFISQASLIFIIKHKALAIA